MKEHFETVIIGGGVSGLSCARRLHAGSRSFVVVTDRLGGRMYHSADGEMNFGATYISEDYENISQFVGRGIPFRLHEVYTENNGKLTTFFDLRNARDALPFARLALRLQELRRTLRRFRKEAEHVSAAELLPRFPLMERYANQSSAELIRDLGLERLDQRYFRSSFFATCFADPALSNALFYLGTLFPLVTSTWVGDFTHTYDRLTEGFADQIEIDKVTSLDRTDGGGWAVHMAGGATYLAKNVVLGIPYHNAEKLYAVPEPYLATSATVLYVRGERHPKYRDKRLMLFHPETSGVALIWQQATGCDLLFSMRPEPDLSSYYLAPEVLKTVTWKTAVVISNANWLPLNLEPNLYLVGDYNLCGLEDSFISGMCAANHILTSKPAILKVAG